MKYFIDCGFYVGKALDYYAPFLDDSWSVWAFEPNITLDVENSLEHFPFLVRWLPAAVWTEDGMLDYTVGGREDAAHITAMQPVEPTTRVPCIDFSRFIKELPPAEVLVVSMDIEGCEFPVLSKMLAEGTHKRITLLDIEFHHRIIEERTEADASQLRRQLERDGVLVKLKVEI